MMQLTEQQRAELERRGFPVTADGMVMVCGYLVDPRSREWRAYLSNMASAAAILGIAPPGYRLVPEEDARLIAAVLSQLSYREVVMYGGFSEAEYQRIRDLAYALSPKEVE